MLSKVECFARVKSFSPALYPTSSLPLFIIYFSPFSIFGFHLSAIISSFGMFEFIVCGMGLLYIFPFLHSKGFSLE